jgi:aminomethyltransferase
MPLWYSKGQLKEHQAVRNACGLFDICHMGEFKIVGKGSRNFLSKILTNNLQNMSDGQAKYNFILNEEGGVIDDCILYCFSEEEWMLVVNAGNIKEDYTWLESHKFSNISLENTSEKTIKIDLQGPNAPKIINKWLNRELLTGLKFFNFITNIKIEGIDVLISRTGYTGEIGFELYTDLENGVNLWKLLLSEGIKFGILPCGLAARDTLRIEAGLPLHGYELRPDRRAIGHPWEFAIDWETDFIGKTALSEKKGEEISYYVIPFKIEGKRKAISGSEVFYQETKIGTVLSCVTSPTLGNVPIGFAGIKIELEPETVLIFKQNNRSGILKGKVGEIPFVPLTSKQKMATFL